jgi:hypothetical protein
LKQFAKIFWNGPGTRSLDQDGQRGSSGGVTGAGTELREAWRRWVKGSRERAAQDQKEYEESPDWWFF